MAICLMEMSMYYNFVSLAVGAVWKRDEKQIKLTQACRESGTRMMYRLNTETTDSDIMKSMAFSM